MVAGRCRGLQTPHNYAVFCFFACSVLQGIAPQLGSNQAQQTSGLAALIPIPVRTARSADSSEWGYIGTLWTPRYMRGSVRHTFLFWLVGRSLDTAQVTVMENVRSANAPRVSVARTTNENVPRVVGVPVIRPGLAVSRRPGGSWPERSVHV